MTTFFVKSAGDGTSITTDPGTGSNWDSAAPDFADVIANVSPALANGDTIKVSHLHSESNSGDVLAFAVTGANVTPVTVISVNNADTGAYLRGGKVTTSVQFTFRMAVHWYGIDWVFTGTNVADFDLSGSKHKFEDCTMEFQNALSGIKLGQPGASAVFNNCDLGGDGVTTITNLFDAGVQNASLQWNGGTVTGTCTNLINKVGGIYTFNGVDLTNVTGTLWVNSGNNLASDDVFYCLIKNCILNSGVALANEVFDSYDQTLEVWNCDDTTGDENLRFFIRKTGGDAESETSIVRTASQALPGTEKLSIKVVSSADASTHGPFVFNIPVRYASTGEAAEDTATVYLTSSATLTDIDVQARLIYPDATTNVQANVVTNAPSISGKPFTLDPFDTGTTLTTSGSVWTNAQTNEYLIVLSTTGDAGLSDANVAPQLEISVTKASTTIYFDSQVDFS